MLSNGKGLSANARLVVLAGVFLFLYFTPFSSPIVTGALKEAVLLLAEYARDHVLLCLIPAFFIAGAIMVFLNQQAVIRYFGPSARKLVSYSVAAVSGSILAVCSCTVLPIFKGIYKKGAGIGPAVSFLYSGPAVNILAIVLTAKVLGLRLGVARAAGAIAFALLIGLFMHLIFRREDAARLTDERLFTPSDSEPGRALWQEGLFLLSMIGILVFLNWAPSTSGMPLWNGIYRLKYGFTAAFAVLLLISLLLWFRPPELEQWVTATRDFALQILPLLFIGVLAAGFLLGRPGHRALIPETWIAALVGGNSLRANLVAALAGAFMYFATLTEVPIMQGLIGAGMGQGPSPLCLCPRSW